MSAASSSIEPSTVGHLDSKANRREVSPLDGLPALISIPLAAEILGLTRPTAYRYAAGGELPVRRLGGRRVYVVTAKLRDLIESCDEAAA